MKRNNLILGIILIVLGVVWLLGNLGYTTWFIWEGLSKFWPLIFVIMGINMLSKRKKYITSIAWIMFLALIIGYGLLHQHPNTIPPASRDQEIVLENRPETTAGRISLELGAGELSFSSTGDALLRAHISSPYITHRADFRNNGQTAVIDFKDSRNIKMPARGKGHSCSFALNDRLSWDIDMYIGAINGTFDLNGLEVNNLNVDMGAGNIKIIFGRLARFCNVDLDTGASNIQLVIPPGIGTRIKLTSVIKGSNLAELGWDIVDGYYTSPGYDSLDKKLDIRIDMGVGKLEIRDFELPPIPEGSAKTVWIQ